MIPAKRTWSGQISPTIITNALERNHPEPILLSPSFLTHGPISDYIEKFYELDETSGVNYLYVKRRKDQSGGVKKHY